MTVPFTWNMDESPCFGTTKSLIGFPVKFSYIMISYKYQISDLHQKTLKYFYFTLTFEQSSDWLKQVDRKITPLNVFTALHDLATIDLPFLNCHTYFITGMELKPNQGNLSNLVSIWFWSWRKYWVPKTETEWYVNF